jgi:hypothetical protein
MEKRTGFKRFSTQTLGPQQNWLLGAQSIWGFKTSCSLKTGLKCVCNISYIKIKLSCQKFINNILKG